MIVNKKGKIVKKMSTKKFVIKTICKVVALIIIATIAFAIIDAVTPVITNDLALGQLEPSDELYIAWETYNKVKPIVSGVATVIIIGVAATIVYDVCKFTHNKIKKED